MLVKVLTEEVQLICVRTWKHLPKLSASRQKERKGSVKFSGVRTRRDCPGPEGTVGHRQ